MHIIILMWYAPRRICMLYIMYSKGGVDVTARRFWRFETDFAISVTCAVHGPPPPMQRLRSEMRFLTIHPPYSVHVIITPCHHHTSYSSRCITQCTYNTLQYYYLYYIFTGPFVYPGPLCVSATVHDDWMRKPRDTGKTWCLECAS